MSRDRRNREETLGLVDGGANFKMSVELPDATGPGKLHIKCLDPKEAIVLQNRFYAVDANGEVHRFAKDSRTLELPPGDIQLYFDKQPAGQIENGRLIQPDPLSLAQTRPIGDTDDAYATTSEESKFVKDLYAKANISDPNHQHSSACNHEHDGKRIDAHTHFVAAFPMQSALEGAMNSYAQEGKKLYVPSLVVLKILKDKGILNASNHDEWMKFFSENKQGPPDPSAQKDNSADLIKEDFAALIKTLQQEKKADELELCVQHEGGNINYDKPVAFHVDVEALKKKCNEVEGGWEHFCKGFDLSASHACDFTDHMETAYALRNWFGKDDHFIRSQIEVIYQEYEKNGINYAELPGGPFKSPKTLEKFIEITREIEQKRAEEGKEPIVLRAGLSIARLIDPAAFRANLFSYAELILKYPEIGSVSVLAHETNPTTEHLLAIQEFITLINKHRPGFTVELHAGEMATHGMTNMSEARSFAKNNPLTLIRGGHTIYGDHKAESMDNFIEEKCPQSNATLIRVEPDVQVDALLGIAEGRSKIFWGSDGVLYNPDYGPDKQKEFFTKLYSHESVQVELKRRYDDADYAMDRFGTSHFDDYKKQLMTHLLKSFSENEKNEDSYIAYKKYEMDFHELKLNIAMMTNLYKNQEMPENVVKLRDDMAKLCKDVETAVNGNSTSPYMELRSQLTDNHKQISDLNTQLNTLCKAGVLPGVNLSDLSKVRREAAYKEIEPDILKQRAAVDLYNKVLKLKTHYEAKKEEVPDIVKKTLSRLEDSIQPKDVPLSKVDLSLLVKQAQATASNDVSQIDALVKKNNLNQKIGDARCESFLDPNYEGYIKIKQMNEENRKLLTTFSAKTEVPKDPVVIFGSPESMQTDLSQKAYMQDLYKNLYVALKDAKDKGQPVVLLAGISEGINPLVYRVLNDHPEVFKDVVPMHVVAHDESFTEALSMSHNRDALGSRAQASSTTVPFFVADKKREEAQIAYADFISQKCNGAGAKVMQFGGEEAVWYDTNVVLNARFRESGRMIQYYQSTEDVPGIKGSSEFAAGNKKQAFNHGAKIDLRVDADSLLDPKYFDEYPKLTSYHRNLTFTYYALKTMLVDCYKLNFDLEISQFLNVYYSQHLVQDKGNIKSNDDAIVKACFQNVLARVDKHEQRDEILKSMMKILSHESGAGAGKLMGKYHQDYDLLNEVRIRLPVQKPVVASQDKLAAKMAPKELLAVVARYEKRTAVPLDFSAIKDDIGKGKIETEADLKIKMSKVISGAVAASPQVRNTVTAPQVERVESEGSRFKPR